MPRTKRDPRPLTLIAVIPPDAPRTEADLTPEQADKAYRALGKVMTIFATIRERRLAEAEQDAA